MKTLAVLLLVVYIVGAHGRHFDHDHNEYEEAPEGEEQAEPMNRMKEHSSQMRHRRRSRQMYGYDYQPPYYYDHRRDGLRQQEEYYSQILKSLDEIIINLRRPPPPPPQPIYIPYPVPYLSCGSRPNQVPAQNVPTANETSTEMPTFPNRFPIIDDVNQLWPNQVGEVSDDGIEGDGSRPISFIPVEPNRPTMKPAPPVEHGSNQAGLEPSSPTTTTPPPRPGTCETAILTCCSVQDRTAQRNCFVRAGCLRTYSTNRACDPLVIQRVLEHFKNAYAPINN